MSDTNGPNHGTPMDGAYSSLNGRYILVIGGGSGIGRATVRLAAARGARLAATVRDEAEAASLRTEIPDIMVAPLELTQRQDLAPALAGLAQTMGRIDAVVYCAGILLRTPTEAMPDEDWDRLIEINLTGLNGLIRSLALEYAAGGLRVNAVGPGPTATPMTEQTRNDPVLLRQTVSNIPMGRYGRPEEIAEVILFLASAATSFVTGQLWCVDGGYTTR
jgi:NAD(P)-dependent dehydrogenase (short-subunit alcohol dehydrogenase family)